MRLVQVVVLVTLASGTAGAQSTGGQVGEWQTPWGDPDLQGTWTNRTTTPLERPSEFADQSVLTGDERAELDAEAERNRDRPPPPGRTGGYNSFWLDRGKRSEQASLIIDPPDGRLPAKTERVREKDAAFEAARAGGEPDSWEDLNLYDRCITRGLPGAMLPGFYNHNYQILQTPDYVVILVEMIHDVRIIPLIDQPPLPPPISQWLGNSRGHWEGDTLVVETSRFNARGDQRVTNLVLVGSEHSQVVERFRRVDADTIESRITITDPRSYRSSWTAQIPMVKLEGPLFEYACHEGNYGLYNILAGARATEHVGGDTSDSR